MSNVSGFIGSDAVELNNAATEETLKKLLAESVKFNTNILRISSVSSGSGGGGGSSTVTAAAAVLTSGFSALNLVTGVIRGTFNILSTQVSNAGAALGGIASAAMSGQGKISQFYSSIQQLASGIPLLGSVLGPVVGLFQTLAVFQEKNLDVYRSLTQVGINFGGGLTQLRLTAANSYLTLQEFGEVMKNNSQAFARMGGNVNTGAQNFAKLSHALVSGDAGTRLLNLGYTTAEVNDSLAKYIGLTGGRNAQELRNTKDITDSGAAYMEQLDGLARITGESRKQQEENMKRAAGQAAWEAKLATMTEQEKSKAVAGAAQQMAIGGKGAMEAFQSSVMGVGPITKAAQQYTGMYGEAAEQGRKSAGMVMNTQKSLADMNRSMFDQQDIQLREGAKYGEQTIYALQANGSAYGDMATTITTVNNRTRQQTREDREAAMQKQNIAGSEAAAMIRGEQALKALGAALWSGLTPIIEALTPIMAGFASGVTEYLTPIVKKFAPVIAEATVKVVDWLKGFFSTLSNASNMTDFFKKFIDGAVSGIQAVWKEIKPAFVQMWESLKPFLASAVTGVMDFIISALRKNSMIARFLFSEPEAEKKQEGPDYSKMTGREGAEENRQKKMAENKAWDSANAPRLSTGTLGTSGKLFENWGSETKVALHGTEAVVTPDQMANMLASAMNTGQNNNLTEQLQRLNTISSEMLRVMKDSSDNIKRNVEATRSLNKNLFA